MGSDPQTVWISFRIYVCCLRISLVAENVTGSVRPIAHSRASYTYVHHCLSLLHQTRNWATESSRTWPTSTPRQCNNATGQLTSVLPWLTYRRGGRENTWKPRRTALYFNCTYCTVHKYTQLDGISPRCVLKDIDVTDLDTLDTILWFLYRTLWYSYLMLTNKMHFLKAVLYVLCLSFNPLDCLHKRI